MNVPVLKHSMPEVLRAVVVTKDKKEVDQSDMVAHCGVERIAAYRIRVNKQGKEIKDRITPP